MTQNFKLKIFRYPKMGGFTLIELLVVISIMILLLSAIVIDIASQTDTRNLAIGESNLVTKLRELQSQALSGRNIGNGSAVQYYIMKFDLSQPGQYTIQAMYNVDIAPQLQDVQTIKFPKGIQFAASNPVVINRTKVPTTQTPASCALVSFQVPFAKTLFTNNCVVAGWNPNSDDYQKILNFITNTDNYPVSTDSSMVITITNAANTKSKQITINAINGVVSFQ